ncbi:MAG: MerR family DNA-binding transcriptional regulator [Coleofasciculus sp. E2-BRE-01]
MSSLTPQEAATLLGVTVKTLHRWELNGKIRASRTAGGHRRYDIVDLIGNKSGNELTVGYARVSSHDQKDDLNRQVLVLESYCAKQGWEFEIIQDLGSGMNYKKKGLIRCKNSGLCLAHQLAWVYEPFQSNVGKEIQSHRRVRPGSFPQIGLA